MQLPWIVKISAVTKSCDCLILQVTCVCAVKLCLVHKIAEKFGFRNIMWNVLLHTLNLALLLSCWFNNVIFTLRYWWGGNTHVTVNERLRQRWDGEREKQIERLPTGNTRGISVKSTLEEDGLNCPSVVSWMWSHFQTKEQGLGKDISTMLPQKLFIFILLFYFLPDEIPLRLSQMFVFSWQKNVQKSVVVVYSFVLHPLLPTIKKGEASSLLLSHSGGIPFQTAVLPHSLHAHYIKATFSNHIKSLLKW